MIFNSKHKKSKEETSIDTDASPTPSDVDKLSINDGEQNSGGQLKEFMKKVISFSGDLSSLTCPAFFLNGLSLLEYGTYWGDHPERFSAISEVEKPEERMLSVARWFISTLWGSYASRCTDGQHEKKPYNPILGEQFHCDLGNVKCICEQVSHHPPVSAFYLEDEKAGLSLNGHSCQRSKFKGMSIRVEQVGRAVLYVKPYNERYLIDFPVLMIRGFFTGAAYIELSERCTIACSNGIRTEIEFVPKPWLGGDYNHIKGEIKDGKKVFYQLSGKWSQESKYKDLSMPPNSEEGLLFNAESEKKNIAKRATKPESEQKDNESHKLWGKVSEALQKKNYTVANAEKSKIEDKQRQIRKTREAEKTEWSPELFKFVKDSDISTEHANECVKLQKVLVGEPDLDNGAWEYVDQLYDRN